MKKSISYLLKIFLVFALLWGRNTMLDIMFADGEGTTGTDRFFGMSDYDYSYNDNTDDSYSAGTYENDASRDSGYNAIDKNGSYFSKEEVALYIHTYKTLPKNFITKDEAADLGWEGGSVEKYAPGCAIGGDRFGNREEQLPKGHTYYECDIDTDGYHSRGSRRIVFSDDGLIYYTHDHYETFELLYGEE